jgi:hypothetical protein
MGGIMPADEQRRRTLTADDFGYVERLREFVARAARLVEQVERGAPVGPAFEAFRKEFAVFKEALGEEKILIVSPTDVDPIAAMIGYRRKVRHTKGLRPVLFAVTLMSACGGAATNPTSDTIPQITGTYFDPTPGFTTAPGGQVWTIKSRQGDNSSRFTSCSGSVIIQQTGSSFTGSFTQGDPCPTITGELTNGVVRLDGTVAAVTFSLVASGSDPLAWTGFAACTPVVNGAMNFTGSINGNLLKASFVRDALIQCPNEGTVTISVTLQAAKY